MKLRRPVDAARDPRVVHLIDLSIGLADRPVGADPSVETEWERGRRDTVVSLGIRFSVGLRTSLLAPGQHGPAVVGGAAPRLLTGLRIRLLGSNGKKK